MAHLALDPQQLAGIDFTTFTFPPVELRSRTSGEDVLMLVWAGEREYLLFDRDVPRDDLQLMAEVLSEIDQFNVDPISGWRELIVAAHQGEIASIGEAQEALRVRRRAAAAALEDAGFAVLRVRSTSG